MSDNSNDRSEMMVCFENSTEKYLDEEGGEIEVEIVKQAQNDFALKGLDEDFSNLDDSDEDEQFENPNNFNLNI